MDGVYTITGEPGVELVTKNLIPGTSVYGEKLLMAEDGEYREWMHSKSKLASGMLRGMRIPALKPSSQVLYLGASSGTTVSHVSDIIGRNGTIFALEFAPRPTRDLVGLANQRENIVPILADVRYPEEYTHLVHGVDVLYADVAQPNQSEIFLKNASAFLKTGGMGYIAIKTRSISQKERSEKIFKDQVKLLESGGFSTIKTVDISKFHKEHRVYLGKWD
jgi:fibrillarin-like pre-rRNA processing protein